MLSNLFATETVERRGSMTDSTTKLFLMAQRKDCQKEGNNLVLKKGTGVTELINNTCLMQSKWHFDI